MAPATLRADIERARMIRRRYTLLDLLDDTGLLERAIHEVFGKGTGREA
jgi:glycerol-1-phosphate dehydrogenase [NAD(P)+]